MRTIKPQRLGVLHRTYEHQGRTRFVVSALVAFALDRPDVPLHEALLWRLVARWVGVDAPFDEAMWKLDGEVLVHGEAYPRGGAQPACQVRLTVGVGDEAPLVDKRLYVVGDRVWGTLGAGDPVPFTAMPLGWSRAFGGPGVAENPDGCGADDGRLPNLEDPRALVRSAADRPAPVGLGAIDLRRPSRQRLAGTYDKLWLERHYPGFPPDIDWRFFQVAPADQRLPRERLAGARFTLENLHPERGRLEGRVPALVVRAFITRAGDAARELVELPLVADTLHLFPSEERGVLVLRGAVDVREDDAADVAELLLAAESPAAPRSREHYAAVLRKRTEGAHRAIHAMADGELLPPLPEGVDPMGHDDLGARSADTPSPMAMNQRRRAERLHAEAQRMTAQTAVAVPELPAWQPPQRDPDAIVALLESARAQADKARADAEQKAKEEKARLDARAAALGFDLEGAMAAQRKRAGGPPKFSAEAELGRLRELAVLSHRSGVAIPGVAERLADPDLAEKLEQLEQVQRAAYRRQAHHFPAASRLEGSEAERLREEVERALRAGERLAGRDLTGADLRALDLQGVDLEGAFLENADLGGANLTRANLRRTVLARADLDAADLTDATLDGANLGKASLRGARLLRADLSHADLSGAELDGAVLDGARLDKATLLGARARGVSFRRVSGARLMFRGLDLSEAVFVDAELPDTIFLATCLERADFTGARLDGACLVSVAAAGAVFDEARASSLRVVAGTDLSGASFRRAQLPRANLRGARMAGAAFDEAELGGADVSEAVLANAGLRSIRARGVTAVRADLRGADLQGADLMLGVLQKAQVAGADLRAANLFRADLARADGDDATRFDGANLEQARIVARRPQP